MVRTCKKCGETKPLEDFANNKSCKYGKEYRCKACVAQYLYEYKGKHHDRLLQRIRERGKEYQRENKEAQRDRLRAKRERWPEKDRARVVVSMALAKGDLKPEPCILCGQKAAAHHEDYNKPLEVIWLCPLHHNRLHYKKFSLLSTVSL